MRELIKVAFDNLYVDTRVVKKSIEEYLRKTLKQVTDKNGKKYKVSKIDCNFASKNFFSVNIYFDNYDANEYFLYYDSKFEDNIQSIVKGLRISYSEQGMQGDDFINLDVFLGARR